MTFEEIFKQDGIYRAESFAPGFCFKIEEGVLSGLQYRDKDDALPTTEPVLVFKALFNKEYTKIFTRQSTFK